MRGWDGESDEFDVKSINGFANLPNLREEQYIAICPEEMMEGVRAKGIKVI